MSQSHTFTWSCDREKYMRIISTELEQCYIEELGDRFGCHWSLKISFERIAKTLEVIAIQGMGSGKNSAKKNIYRHNYVFNFTLQRNGKDLSPYISGLAKLVYGTFIEDCICIFNDDCHECDLGACDTSSLDDYRIDLIVKLEQPNVIVYAKQA